MTTCLFCYLYYFLCHLSVVFLGAYSCNIVNLHTTWVHIHSLMFLKLFTRIFLALIKWFLEYHYERSIHGQCPELSMQDGTLENNLFLDLWRGGGTDQERGFMDVLNNIKKKKVGISKKKNLKAQYQVFSVVQQSFMHVICVWVVGYLFTIAGQKRVSTLVRYT